MTIDFLTLSHKIVEVINNSISQQIVFFRRSRSGRHTSKYSAYNYEFAPNFENDLKNIVNNNVETNARYRLLPFSIDLETVSKNTILELNAKDVFNLSKIMTEMYNNIAKIDTKNIEDVSPNFYALNFENSENQVIAFTHYSPVTVFKGKFIFGLQAEVYKECVSIKNHVDCLYYKLKIDDENLIENIVIFNNSKTDFENIFDYKDVYRDKATKALKQIESCELLSNIELFAKFAFQDENIIKKLAKIHSEDKIQRVLSNFKNVVDVNTKFEELNIKIDNEKKLIIIPDDATKDYIKSVLSILNTEPVQNMITEDKLLLADNNVVQQKLLPNYIKAN